MRRTAVRAAIGATTAGLAFAFAPPPAVAKVDSERFSQNGNRGIFVVRVTRESDTSLRVKAVARFRARRAQRMRIFVGCEAMWCTWRSWRFRIERGYNRIDLERVVRGRAYFDPTGTETSAGQGAGPGGPDFSGLIPQLPPVELPGLPPVPQVPVDPGTLPVPLPAGKARASRRSAKPVPVSLPVECGAAILREPRTYNDTFVRSVCVN